MTSTLLLVIATLLLDTATLGDAANALDRPPAVAYRLDAVQRKVFRAQATGERRLDAGEALHGGDRLRTGWRSSAEIVAPEPEARFYVRARTRVRLAADRPGVLIELEQGRLRAVFEKLTGRASAERRVVTPSAVLAVRGTEYGVSVSRSGNTSLVVFSGTVEVLDPEGRFAPTLVSEGFALEMRRGQGPGALRPHRMEPRGWDRTGMTADRGMGSAGMGGGAGMSGAPARSGGMRGGSGRRGHG